jgi:succinate-semialdehyde dehydrogenase/glutarate-semialdehyde dehydrogenase
LVLGGIIPEGKAPLSGNNISWFRTRNGSIWQRGPAACDASKDDAHAVELANNSQFGLGSGVFTEYTTWRKISFTTGSRK